MVNFAAVLVVSISAKRRKLLHGRRCSGGALFVSFAGLKSGVVHQKKDTRRRWGTFDSALSLCCNYRCSQSQKSEIASVR